MKRHLMLFSDSSSQPGAAGKNQPGHEDETGCFGHWRFLLEDLASNWRLEATDAERDVFGERLELLAVIRGLESIDGPARVTLITPSRYVSQGLRFGLPQWRADNWQWERHGVLTEVRNADLWRRVDRALQFHELQSRYWRMDRGELLSQGPHIGRREPRAEKKKLRGNEAQILPPTHRWTDWLLRPRRTRGEQNLPEKTAIHRSVALA